MAGRCVHSVPLATTRLPLNQDARSSKIGCGMVRGRSLSNSKSLSGGLLLGDSDLSLVTLLHFSAFLDTVELNVAVGRKVGSNATVGTVGSSASLNGSLDNNVADDALVDIESLGLSVSLEVDKKLLDGLAGLFWPSTEWKTVDLGLRSSSDTSRVLPEGNDGLVCDDSVHVLDGSLDLHSLAEACCFITVLVVGSQVGNSAFSSYRNEEIREIRHEEIREISD